MDGGGLCRCYGDKPASFMRLSPNGLLPVANIDGQVIREVSPAARLAGVDDVGRVSGDVIIMV